MTPAAGYSFIDVAVLDAVRGRFAAGDALIAVSTDLDAILWANGLGAAAFGFDDLEEAVGAPTLFSDTTRRQIMATAGFPRIGRDRNVAVRVTRALDSLSVVFQASEIVMPDGETAILFALPSVEPGDRTAAGRALAGFVQPGYHAAFLDARGQVEAATPGFAVLGVPPETRAALIAETGPDRRIVRRLIPAENGALPAGLVRLRDSPVRALLVVIDEAALDDGLAPAPQAERSEPMSVTTPTSDPFGMAAEGIVAEPPSPDLEPPVDLPVDEPRPSISAEDRDQPETIASTVSANEPAPLAHQQPATVPADDAPPLSMPAPGDLEDGPDTDVAAQVGMAASTDQESEPGAPADGPVPGPVADAGEADAPPSTRPSERVPDNAFDTDPAAGGPDATDTAPANGPGLVAERDSAAEPEPGAAAAAPDAGLVAEPDRASAPVRFVWRTDAEGRFSELSPQFVAAVGSAAGALVGRGFREVAEAFGLDPDGEIAGLLERRDTWSGRSVFWPVADTDLRVPVDLAALPVYGRDRSFEGFRGFGVLRMADAVVDPDALGLSLGGAGEVGDAQSEVWPPEPAEDDPFRGEPPALMPAPARPAPPSTKVISLADHRQQPERVLSSTERTAFQEIGARLRHDVREPPSAAPEADATADGPRTPAGHGSVASPMQGTAQDEVPSGSGDLTPSVAPNEAPVEAERPASQGADEAAGPPAEAPEFPAPTATADDGPSVAFHAAETKAGSEIEGSAGRTLVAEPALFTPEDEPEAVGTGTHAPTVDPAPVDEVHPVDEAPHAPDDANDHPVQASEPAGDAAATLTAPSPRSASVAPPPPDPSPAIPPALPTGRVSTAELKIDGFLPSAFSGPAAQVQRPFQETAILSRLPVPILIHAGDTLHYANEEFLALTGYRSLDALEDAGGLDALFPDSDRAAGGEADDRALHMRAEDGEAFAVEALLRSVPWQGGRALMLVIRRTSDDEAAPAPDPSHAAREPATVISLPPAAPLQRGTNPDAQPSHQAGDLRAEVEEMRAIVDTATDGIVLIDRGGTILSISRPAEALFGFDSAEAAGKPFASLFAIESQRAARDYLAGLAENGVASVLNDGREVIGREAQGRFIPLFMTIGRLPNDGGYCAVLRDITQWKRAEEELTQARTLAERSSSQKTEFLARVSHEIRTPLNAIIGFSELMTEERFGPIANDRYREYLRDIHRSGNHVLDLVNDLLDITKIEAGEQDMTYEAVSLNEVLAETVAMMQPQANRERVIIRSSLSSILPDVVADRRSVRQIALNLMSNAVHYTQAGGQVIVSTALELSGEVVMRVRDTGIGMTAQEIEQALKPFKQINALRRTRGDGTGLGLPLTKAMVEANRARFTIASTPGEGTIVEVSFPPTRVLAG